MPVLGTIGLDDGNLITPRVATLDVLVPVSDVPGGQGPINTLIFPVIPDAPAEGDTAATLDPAGVLALAVGTEWFCERIVGSLYVGLQLPDTGVTFPPSALVAAGFFVARCNDDDSGGGQATPIGSASAAERNANYSPLHIDAVREPWMWRKSWLLGGAVRVQDGFSEFPTTNAFYGSIADGPKVDCKSVRRIGQDDRLFFAISTVCLRGPQEGVQPGRIDICLDVRVLGNTRKAKNDGKF